MRKVIKAAQHLEGLEAYDPRYLPAKIYLNANENPYGISDAVREELTRAASHEQLHRYPDPLAKELRNILATQLKLDPGCVLLGNGGDELLFNVCLAYGGPGRTLLTTPPTFSVYDTNAQLSFTKHLELARNNRISPEKLLDFSVDEQAVLTRLSKGDISIVILTSPNNPTGDCLSLGFIEAVLNATEALVLIDQAYIEFAAPGFDALPLFSEHANLAILRTFSKAYGLAGLRIGYLLAHPEVIHELQKVRQPYSLDTLAARAARAALEDPHQRERQVSSIKAERERLSQALGLSGLGLPLAPSEANYLLVRIPRAEEVWRQLYEEYGILVRNLSSMPALEDCLRVSIGTPSENDAFLAALRLILDAQQKAQEKENTYE